MPTIKLTVPSISCQHCIRSIKMDLMEIEGVKEVVGDVSTKEIQLTYESPATEEAILEALRQSTGGSLVS